MTPRTAARQASVSITNSWSLLKLKSIELVMPSNHLILHCPLLPPSLFPNNRVFSNESVLRIRWPKYWSFSFSISSSTEYSGLITQKQNICWEVKEFCYHREKLLCHSVSESGEKNNTINKLKISSRENCTGFYMTAQINMSLL